MTSVEAQAQGSTLAGRFSIRSQLGSGAFGTVYAAEDLSSGARVAVKRLTRVTGATIYRFKKEFRALAGHRHPNLVRLDELFSEGGEWFFSMELVDGVPFDVWVLGPQHEPQPAPTLADDAAAALSTHAGPAPAPDVDKLRPALAQLVSAIAELHSLGVVHRDLKPANVLVTREGRVVLLDFGLVTDADPDAQKSTLGVVMGTPTYMAPEQALGRVTTPAADWYALGAMLFQVLYGYAPFSGTAHDTLTAKLSSKTRRWPESRGAAPDLEQLCQKLLVPEPDDRPDVATIVAAVRAAPYAPTGPVETRASFVGRDAEIASLLDAFALAQRGRPVVVRVRGQSGIGKSALLKEVTRRLDAEAVVLEGRCYERESVPYKALDGVVDALTRYLSGLSVEQASLLVPRNAQALCRLFPVFSRLRLLAEAADPQRSWSPHEARRRGFDALREVFSRIADRRALVVVIDDLQWGDQDSIEPLRALLAAPDPPPLLLLLAYRSEDEERSPTLTSLRESPLLEAPDHLRELELLPLAPDEARALAERLLPPAERHRAEAVARESGGLPFFLPELARANHYAEDPAAPVSLDEVVRRRVQDLSPTARRLLTVLAVAGRPMRRAHVWRAAGVDAGEAEAVDELVREHFIKSGSSEESLLETYHDRVRESVVSSLSDEEQRAIHAEVAAALAEAGDADPEALAEHYRLAGHLSLARPAAVAAAERATLALAFQRAIALYRVAREDAPSAERRLLTARLADALAYAGRSLEAADAYLEAVEGAPEAEARELRRRAAELLLRGGAMVEGIALARQLLVEAGLPWAESRSALLASVGSQRALLRLRGHSYREHSLGADDELAASRVDLCATLGTCLSPLGSLRATDYQTRQLRLALALGDPYRVAIGFALESMLLAVGGQRSNERSRRLAIRSAEIARRIDNAHAIGWATASLAVCDWGVARWRRAVSGMDDALSLMRARCPDGAWQMAVSEIWFRNRPLFFLGELTEFIVSTQRAVRAAEELGDRLTLTTALAAGMPHVHLIRDRPAEARESSARGIRDWTKEHGWNLQHNEDLRANAQCDVYEGDGASAIRRITDNWGELQRSMVLRAESVRIQTASLCVNAALVAGDVNAAERWTKRLAEEKNPWGRAMTEAARAGVLALRGSDEAPDRYDSAAVQLDALEMLPFAAAARRRRGELLGGSEGERLIAEADELLTARGVTNPGRFVRILIA